MDLPEKKVVAGARHWRTLLQICHDFQGDSGGEIQLGIFNEWIQQSGLYLIHCFTVESLECPFILASIMIFLKQSGFPNLERH